MAEEQFGIKADLCDAKRLEEYVLSNCNGDRTEFLKTLFSNGEAAEFLTVNETYFFREPIHFSLLLDLLPSFENSQIRICSAAAAVGCEAYSIAMLIETYNKSVEKPVRYQIDAFDINAHAIEIARQGVYNARTLREDGNCFRYMMIPYIKESDNKYYTDDSLKNNINFFVHNLMDELLVEKYDIIFFRNAFIYFLPQKRERILSNLSLVLKENGILILGVSETAGVQHIHLMQKNQRLPPSFDDVFYFYKTAMRSTK
jgi:chemotaxis protein methyltransferase CheR